jgi:putative FmdB family regulatory protein
LGGSETGLNLKQEFELGEKEEFLMPLYEYKCQACGHTFEKLALHEEKETKCPQCGGGVQKIMSPFSYQVFDEVCGKLPKGEKRELCTECRQGGGTCPVS